MILPLKIDFVDVIGEIVYSLGALIAQF